MEKRDRHFERRGQHPGRELFKSFTTAGNRATQAVDRWPERRRISTAYLWRNRRSVRVRLNLSTMA